MFETISDEREISAVKLAVVALNQAALVVLVWVVKCSCVGSAPSAVQLPDRVTSILLFSECLFSRNNSDILIRYYIVKSVSFFVRRTIDQMV